MMNAGPIRGQPLDLIGVLVRLRGTGATAPTVEVGPNGRPGTRGLGSGALAGVTATRAAAGDYTLTFSEKPGEFLGMTAGHGASTPAATTPRFVEYEEDTAFVGTGQTIRIFTVTPATDAAAAAASDLAATDVVTLIFWFRR